MILPENYTVEMADWGRDKAALSSLRHAVFVLEQKVPPEIEIDELDPLSSHAIARDSSGTVIGTGRLIPPSRAGELPRIGRMAVARGWRRAGVGGAILKLLCDEAQRQGFREVTLHSQTHASAFYFRHGFLSHGAEFNEAGIPHQEMRKTLPAA